MHKVSIKPQWTISYAEGKNLSPRLLELLTDVQEQGSLYKACELHGGSYRHAWSLIREGEEQLGTPLLFMRRGKGSTLTPIAEKLVWASHRVFARLSPTLDTLASELEVELANLLTLNNNALKVHASHGFAIEKLIDTLIAQGTQVERKYVGSQEALASFHDGHCELAGFHVPQGEFEDLAFDYYAKWLDPQKDLIIHVATRDQGLMVAQGNPFKVSSVADLTKPGLRFINRQASSGTYFLLDCLLKKANISPATINGFNQSEFTHAAIAAYVASGMADAGIGVQTPSKHFKLDFIPLATERYFLVCKKENIDLPLIQSVLKVLNDIEFHRLVNELGSYRADQCGTVQAVKTVFPQLKST